MTPRPFVRRATPADAAEIARLNKHLGYDAAPEEIARRLSALVDNEKQLVAVAETGSTLGGWIAAEERLVLESGEQTEIVGLVVDPRCRLRGTGRSLVLEVERWADSRGFARIVVRSNVVRKESHAFFQAAGFVSKKTQHVYVKYLSDNDDALQDPPG